MFTISKKWSKISQRESNPFCPYVYLHNIDEQELIAIKKEFQEENFLIIDGFDYYGASFCSKSICKTANWQNQIRLKIINNLEYINLILSETLKTKEIYQFYQTTSFYENSSHSIKNIRIQFEELKDIKEVI